MKQGEKKAFKTLLTSCLVVALVGTKEKLERHLPQENAFVYFLVFITALFVLAAVEYAFDKAEESDWFSKLFFKSTYIRGWWLNYAVHIEESKGLYNFALLKIDFADDQYNVDGQAFRVACKGKGNFKITPDGHFSSTIAQFRPDRGLLGFNYTVDSSEKVSSINKISGMAEYFFERADGIPKNFTGQFATASPQDFCTVFGHRVEDEDVIQAGSIVERYRLCLDLAIQKNWIKEEQIPSMSENP
jgi:hypothetical protein